VLNIPVVMKEINKKILKPISLTSETIQYLERSSFLLNNYRNPNNVENFNKLVFSSYLNVDMNKDGLPDTWWVWNPEGVELVSEIIEHDMLKFRNVGTGKGGIATRKFILQPNTKYVLEVKIRGNLVNGQILSFNVLSDKGKHVQLEVPDVKVDSFVKDYKYEFITSDDINGGKQFIRLNLTGSDKGYIELSGISIYGIE
jgi:hypothetical protein